ncbi:MAG: hypothetical protein FJZ87_11320 [Chloroflexi bacterium]|nr:hypothetical protein [Chloroflexota bacterium]
MKRAFLAPGERIPHLVILAALLTSRILYNRAGVQFEGDPEVGAWHLIDPALYQTDFLRSIFHLHSQPPLMNFFIGFVYRSSPSFHQEVLQILYLGMGVLLAISIYRLCKDLELGGWLSSAFTICFMVSPATVFYERSLSYGYPITVLLALAGVFFFRFAGHGRNGHFLFWSLALMALTWSLFHWVWLLLVWALTFTIHTNRRQVILAGLAPFLLVTTRYGKNLVQVGDFTSSTWAGMNLSKIVTFRTPEKERKQMIRRGELSEFALIPPFRNPLAYLEILPHTPKTGIPVLDDIYTSIGSRKFQQLVYAEASRLYLMDALHLIRAMPEAYLRSIFQAVYIFFHPASDFDPILGNRSRIWEFDQWWNRIFHGQWLGDETSIERNVSRSILHVGWWILAGFLGTVVFGVRYLWIHRMDLSSAVPALVVFMMFNILYVTLIGNTMDIGENNRFRFSIDPYLMVLPVFLAKIIVVRDRNLFQPWRR